VPFAAPASVASFTCSSIDSVMTAFEGFRGFRVFTCDNVLTIESIAFCFGGLCHFDISGYRGEFAAHKVSQISVRTSSFLFVKLLSDSKI